jgi:hypothetical protein
MAQPASRANAAERGASAFGSGLVSAGFAPDVFGYSPPHRSLLSLGGVSDMDRPEQSSFCPICSAAVTPRFGAGMWRGRSSDGSITGPAYDAICEKCGTKLFSLPTREDAEAGRFVWEKDSE